MEKNLVPSFRSSKYLHWVYLEDFVVLLLEHLGADEEPKKAQEIGKHLNYHFASKKLDLHKEEVGRGFGLNIGMTLDEAPKAL